MRDYIAYLFVAWLWGLVALTLSPSFFPTATDLIRQILLWTFFPMFIGLVYGLAIEYRIIRPDRE